MNISVGAEIGAQKIDLPGFPDGLGVVLPRRDEVGGGRSQNRPQRKPTKAAASCCRWEEEDGTRPKARPARQGTNLDYQSFLVRKNQGKLFT